MTSIDTKEPPKIFYDETLKKLESLLDTSPVITLKDSQVLESSESTINRFFILMKLYHLVKEGGLPWLQPSTTIGNDGKVSFEWKQNNNVLGLAVNPNGSSEFIKGLTTETSEIVEVSEQSFDTKLIDIWKWLLTGSSSKV